MSIVAHNRSRTLYAEPLLKRRPSHPAQEKSLRPVRRRSSFSRNLLGFHGGSIDTPRAIPDADWQAGVTPGNEFKRVTLDGEPVPSAVAASARFGWVVVQLFGAEGRVTGTQRRHGVVRIVAGDRV